MNVQVFVFCVAIVAVGYGLTYLLDVRLRPEERLSYGTVIGAIVVSTVAFPLAWAYEFGATTVVLATALSLAGAWWAAREHLADVGDDWREFWRRLRSPLSDPENPFLWVGLTALSVVVSVRILTFAYEETPTGGIAAGSLSTFGDWAAHLAYAGSFANGDNFPPVQPTAAGEDFVYHFGIDFFSALFVPFGASLFSALTISTGLLSIAIPGALYCSSHRIVNSRGAAALGTIFFLTAGGTAAGWDRFVLDDLPDKGWGVIWNLPRSYAFDGFDKLWVDNIVSGFLYPQRPSLVGFPLTMMVLALTLPRLLGRPKDAPTPRGMIFLGVLVGLLPYWHVFALPIVLGLIGFWWLLDRARAAWLYLLVPAVAIAVPLFLLVHPPEGGRDIRLWWVRGIDGSWWGPPNLLNIPGFWLYQTGLFLPLLAWAMFSTSVLPRRLVGGLVPIWILLVMPEIAFWHHHPLNNSKYIAFLFLLGSPLVAALLWRWIRGLGVKGALGIIIVLFSVLTGVLDIWRLADRTSSIYADGTGWPYPAEIFTASDLLLADWVRDHTDPHAVFASVEANQPAVSAVGNRRVVVESTGRLNDLGIEYSDRRLAVRDILDQAPGYEALIAKYGVDYVLIGPNELADQANRGVPDPRTVWAATGTLVYDLGGQKIFAVNPPGADLAPPEAG